MDQTEEEWKIFACPYCGGGLERQERGVVCYECGSFFPSQDDGVIDFRLKKPKNLTLDFSFNSFDLVPPDFKFDSFKEKADPENDFSKITLPYHLSSTMMSYFPKSRDSHGLALDLGCGQALHRSIIEKAGYRYYGVDVRSKDAPILADAHALPFKDASFDFIFSINTLMEVQYPFIVMMETARVLAPGGIFLGSVAFNEPFDGFSFYHHTHLGIYNSLAFTGLKVEMVAPVKEWSAIKAQGRMGLFPQLPNILCDALTAPLQALSHLYWKLGGVFSNNATEYNRILYTTGEFSFLASKSG